MYATVETIAIRRFVLSDAVTQVGTTRTRMVISPEDNSAAGVDIPYAPREIDHSNLAAKFAVVSRPGLPDAILFSGRQPRTMAFSMLVADKTDYRSPLPGSGRTVVSASGVINALRSMADRGTKVRVAYGSFEAGSWRITNLSLRSTQRDVLTDEITQADVSMEFTQVSDIVVGVGPLSGGVTPPPSPTSPRPTPQATLYYTVKEGDTLIGISIAYYGTGDKWRQIGDANGIVDPRKLPIGKVLRIP